VVGCGFEFVLGILHLLVVFVDVVEHLCLVVEHLFPVVEFLAVEWLLA